MNNRLFNISAAGLFLTALLGYFGMKLYKTHNAADSPASSGVHSTGVTNSVAHVTDKGTTVTANLVSGKFSLTDHTGRKRTHRDFRGRLTVVYFGYTFCPDICPQALSNISEALYALKEKAGKINFIFISVDPERDTVEELARFRENFHPQLIALTGTDAEVHAATQSFRVYFNKLDDGKNSDYLVDHSSIVYVMDARGRLITSFNHETASSEIKNILQDLL